MSNIINLFNEPKCNHGIYTINGNDVICFKCKETVNANEVIRDLWFGLDRRVFDVKTINKALIQYVNPDLLDYRIKQVEELEMKILRKSSELKRLTELINELRIENRINVRLVTDGSEGWYSDDESIEVR